MWNVPTAKLLDKIPRLYATEHQPLGDKLIYLHFFIGGCDWYIAEYDDESLLFFGFAILNDDHQCSEWGYCSFSELKELNIHGLEVDCELEDLWEIRKASEIPGIKTYS